MKNLSKNDSNFLQIQCNFASHKLSEVEAIQDRLNPVLIMEIILRCASFLMKAVLLLIYHNPKIVARSCPNLDSILFTSFHSSFSFHSSVCQPFSNLCKITRYSKGKNGPNCNIILHCFVISWICSCRFIFKGICSSFIVVLVEKIGMNYLENHYCQ